MNSYKDIKEEVSISWTFLRWGLLIVIICGFLAGVINAMGFVSFAFWTPKVEQVRYNTFKQSQSYNEGMVRDLENLKMEYLQSNSDQKAALKAIIIHRFGAYNIDLLPTDLQLFYITLQGV